MSATAQSASPVTTSDAGIDDALARKNALVLAVAQALAGGNNTVIVSTGARTAPTIAPVETITVLLPPASA